MGLKNKKKIIIVVIIITLIISISTVSYALWTTKFTQTGQNSITTGCLDIKFTEGDSINITNGYPITDEAGKKSKGTEFSITNTCTIPVAYEVVLDEITTTLADNNLKINVSGSREIEPVLLSEMSETNPVPLSDQEVSSARSILKDVVPGAEASGQTGGKKTYVLRLWIRGDISTNLGRGKEFKGRIAIRANQINKNDKILVNNIIANNPIQTETPDFSKGFPNSETSEEETKKLSGLYKAEDDEGESYYFRGAVENNYVKFGKGKTWNNQEEHDLMWRIVRINGDGTIRLLLNEYIDIAQFNTINNEAKYVGFTYDNKVGQECTLEHPCEVSYNSGEFSNENFGGQDSNIKTVLETWYKSNLNSVNDKIANGYFCNDTSYGSGNEGATTSGYLHYGAYNRVITNKQPILKCPNPLDKEKKFINNYGGIYKTKIGLITADEVGFAGFGWSNEILESNYLFQGYNYWTISPSYYTTNNGIYRVRYSPSDNNTIGSTMEFYRIVPVINLSTNVLVTSGVGSKQSPFIIN